MIQLRLKTRLNNDLNTDFCSEGNEIKLEKSFLDLYIKNNNINNININEINLNDDNNIINENNNNVNSYIDIFVNVIN